MRRIDRILVKIVLCDKVIVITSGPLILSQYSCIILIVRKSLNNKVAMVFQNELFLKCQTFLRKNLLRDSCRTHVLRHATIKTDMT